MNLQVSDPIIYLGIDNCFASKRWTQPEDWCHMIQRLGLTCIEASADTECDPLYMGKDYINDWIHRVRQACHREGTRIVNLYSGHGTYATLGLCHWDDRVKARFRDRWIKEQANTARELGAGLGFFAHAFDESVLQNPELYPQHIEALCQEMANIAMHCASIGVRYVGVEQMYSPNQPPWTIDGAKAMLRRIYEIGKAPFYLTDDVGHMNGQQYFMKPTEDSILDQLQLVRQKAGSYRIWMGSHKAMGFFKQAVAGELSDAAAVDKILLDAEKNPHLFAQERDGCPYVWLEETACYSPIIHLQQSDGSSSPHWPFDRAHNQKGIIDAPKVLKAIQKSYCSPEEAGMPQRCAQITLTLEPFINTAGNIYDAIRELQESVAYWRQYIPMDGMPLSQLIGQLP